MIEATCTAGIGKGMWRSGKPLRQNIRERNIVKIAMLKRSSRSAPPVTKLLSVKTVMGRLSIIQLIRKNSSLTGAATSASGAILIFLILPAKDRKSKELIRTSTILGENVRAAIIRMRHPSPVRRNR
jgi:hypothetical protein